MATNENTAHNKTVFFVIKMNLGQFLVIFSSFLRKYGDVNYDVIYCLFTSAGDEVWAPVKCG